MLAQSLFSRSSCTTYNNRVFVYEITGLCQNEQLQNQIYPIRKSSHSYFQVPFGKMNQAMKRFTRLGATIVSIQPLEDFKADNQQTATVHSTDDSEE